MAFIEKNHPRKKIELQFSENKFLFFMGLEEITEINENFSDKINPSEGEATILWKQCSIKLKKRISPQFYSAFFEDISPVFLSENSLSLRCPDPRVALHVKKRYSTIIEKDLSLLTGKKLSLVFESEVKEKKSSVDVFTETVNKKKVFHHSIKINSKYTFNRFITGVSNEHAASACLGAAQAPGKYHNPIYIFGEVGVGKTHLMMAIGNYITEHSPWLKVLYTPSDIFQSDLFNGINKKDLSSFRNKYRDVDVFLFDDIQFIKQRSEFTQEEIFHTFNFLYQNHKQIVISGDRSPHKLSHLSDRLLNRFQSGLVVDIKPPSYETRVKIIHQKALAEDILISEDVANLIASKIKRQIRKLESVLIQLKFLSDFENRPINEKMANEALKNLQDDNVSSSVCVNEVIQKVAKAYYISEKEIIGKSRIEAVVFTRHLSMYLVHKLVPSMTLLSIAKSFHRSDHTTVMHALNKVRELMKNDSNLKQELTRLADELISGH